MGLLLGLADKVEYQRFEEILSENPCYRISDLRVNGNDLAAIGIMGKEIGESLNTLLRLVAEGRVENEKDALLNQVAKYR